MNHRSADIAIIGAGAAGLFAAIWAARTNRQMRVIAVDGAARIGAKILISGGGRCNVTHNTVDEKVFAGSTSAAIRKVLLRFGVSETSQFFASLGVELKEETSGKLFPVTDRAQTILNALLRAAQEARAIVLTSHRVLKVRKEKDLFEVSGDWGSLSAQKLIIATGGKSVPKTGSDGYGYQFATSLGHTVTAHVFPALVPLTLPEDHFLTRLSGVSADVQISVHSSSGKLLKSFRNSLLCTHFGISGPAVLDISRYYIDARRNDPGTILSVNWMPSRSSQDLDYSLQQINRAYVLSWLRRQLPERLAQSLLHQAKLPEDTPGYRLTREQRKQIVLEITQTRLPVIGNRGFRVAEVTAGGIPLKELNLQTLESRICPGLFFCGEICDVDGQIGGYNFQWSWASGYVAGISAARK